MPFQPTYPKPYNEGVNVLSEDGISFECTVDEYDTIYNSELFIKDINTGKELLRLYGDSESFLKKIKSFEIAEEDISKLVAKLGDGEHTVEFEDPNLPYIYKIDEDGNIELLQKGSQYYYYRNGEYTLLDGTFEDAAILVRGQANGFESRQENGLNTKFFEGLNLEGTSTINPFCIFPVTFENGEIVLEKLKNNLEKDIVKPGMEQFTYRSGSSYSYATYDRKEMVEQLRGKDCAGLIYIKPPYVLNKTIIPPKVLMDSSDPWVIMNPLLVKLSENGPITSEYVTDFSYVQCDVNYSSGYMGNAASQTRIKETYIISTIDTRAIKITGETIRRQVKIDGKTYYNSAPTGATLDFLCPQAIGIPLLWQSDGFGNYNNGLLYYNSNVRSSIKGIRLINQGYGYVSSSTPLIQIIDLEGNKIDITENINLSETSSEKESYKIDNIDYSDKKSSSYAYGSIVTRIGSNEYSSGTPIEFGEIRTIQASPTPPDNYWAFKAVINQNIYIAPPPPMTATITISEGKLINSEITRNYKGYIIPPKFVRIKDENTNTTTEVSVNTILEDIDYIYSTDGGATIKTISSALATLPNYPIFGGKGDESRILFNLSNNFIQEILNVNEDQDNYLERQMCWNLRLYGSKEDVFVYSGENFNKIAWQDGLNLAIMANNSNISTGATIYKNYKNSSVYSKLVSVENQFKGINISSVKAISENKYYETITSGTYKNCYKINLNTPISIPQSPYVNSKNEDKGITNVYNYMKCLLNGLEYDVASFEFLNGKINSIILKNTSDDGVKVEPEAIMENMRVEVYRTKSIGILENSEFDLEDYDTYTIWSNSLYTQQYFFEGNEGQVIALTPSYSASYGDGNTLENPYIFSSCNISFEGAYEGDLLWNKWELQKSTDGVNFETIETTPEIYSTNLNKEYIGLDAGVIYKVKLIISNNLSQVVEREKYFRLSDETEIKKEEIEIFNVTPKLVFDVRSGWYNLGNSENETWSYYLNNVAFDSTNNIYEHRNEGMALFRWEGEKNYVYVYNNVSNGTYLIFSKPSSLTNSSYGDTTKASRFFKIGFSETTIPDDFNSYPGSFMEKYYLSSIEALEELPDFLKYNIPLPYSFKGYSLFGEIDCDKLGLKVYSESFSKDIFKTFYNFNTDEFIALKYVPNKIIIHKENLLVKSEQKNFSFSENQRAIYDYALSNNNDYFYLAKVIYKVYKFTALGYSEDFIDEGNFSFTGEYVYSTLNNSLIVSSSGLSEKEVTEGYEGDYQFLKYHWNKLLILDTEKRLSQDLEDGEYYISQEPYSKWDFQLSLSDADISITTDAGVFEGLYQFPRVNETYRNFKTQSLSCDLGKIDNSTNWRYGRSSVNLIDEWLKFCNNGKVKILRDLYGNLLPVKITAKSYKCSNTKPMMMNISFDWTQVGSEDLIAIESVKE